MLARVVILAAVVLVAVGALSGSGLLERLAPALTEAAAPEPAPAPARGPVVLEADGSGHYMADGSINGRPVRFVVDTGATRVALSAETARRIGLAVDKSAFTAATRTANGTVAAAPIRLAEVRIGGARIADVDALVLPEGALDVDLLGMSFLSRLGGFRVTGRQMVLSP
ncbi:MAG: TIGR02281 family clan AA aspartic protease [Bosea sp.]|nr:TIGR02281 family clan AA aspartic protease [Bosea sp. (in: a-proteobacteria)]